MPGYVGIPGAFEKHLVWTGSMDLGVCGIQVGLLHALNVHHIGSDDEFEVSVYDPAAFAVDAIERGWAAPVDIWRFQPLPQHVVLARTDDH